MMTLFVVLACLVQGATLWGALVCIHRANAPESPVWNPLVRCADCGAVIPAGRYCRHHKHARIESARTLRRISPSTLNDL